MQRMLILIISKLQRLYQKMSKSGNTPILQKYMKANVRIIVSNKTLWQQVFG